MHQISLATKKSSIIVNQPRKKDSLQELEKV